MPKLRTTHFEQIPLAALKKILGEQANQETDAPAETIEKTETMEMDASLTEGDHVQEVRG